MKTPFTSGGVVTEAAPGANLVEGRETWQHAQESKNDLQTMLKCCEAELATMQLTGLVAAPFFFERAALLFRKAKQFEEEIEICERYIQAIGNHYATAVAPGAADVRKGPSFQAIQSRASIARELLARSRAAASEHVTAARATRPRA